MATSLSFSQTPVFGDPRLCPSRHPVQNACANRSFTLSSLFTQKEGFGLADKGFTKSDRCKMWWWASEVHHWNYPPLTEWAEDAQDALMSSGDPKDASALLGPAPEAPHSKLVSSPEPSSSCEFAMGPQSQDLVDILRTLDFGQLHSRDIRELVDHCIAFEVAATTWKRMEGNVIEAFLLPVGDINIVIFGQTTFKPIETIEAGVAGTVPDGKISYRAIGTCSVGENPKFCVEDFMHADSISPLTSDREFHHEFKVGPYRTDLDGLLDNRWPQTRKVDLRFDENGKLAFYPEWDSDDSSSSFRSHPLRVSLYQGHLALVTNEKQCTEYGATATTEVYLRPLAFGDVLDKLYSKELMYEPKDFPAPNTSKQPDSAVERGCNNSKSYSLWASEEANAALHMAHHNLPFDNLYHAIAADRRLWKVNGDRPGRSRTDAVTGNWRTKPEETALPISDDFETQARNYVQGSRTEASDSDMLYRLTTIDGVEANEVWYYKKPQAPSGAIMGTKSHVIIRHLAEFNDIYASSVIGRLVEVYTRCANTSLQKKEFLAAMYSLFNAVPLEGGESVVGKVFMAVTYERIFGHKLNSMHHLSDIDMDALTMTRDDFQNRYLPLL